MESNGGIDVLRRLHRKVLVSRFLISRRRFHLGKGVVAIGQFHFVDATIGHPFRNHLTIAGDPEFRAFQGFTGVIGLSHADHCSRRGDVVLGFTRHSRGRGCPEHKSDGSE